MRNVGVLLRYVVMNGSPTWMSTKDAARYLGVNLRTLYRFIDEGELAAYKFGRVIRLKEDDLQHFVDAAKIVPGTLEHLYPMAVHSAVS